MILYLFMKQLNSLTKDKFIRLNLLEAHNSLFNYDIISLCETSKNDTFILLDLLAAHYDIISHWTTFSD